jgi:hypothetical protein
METKQETVWYKDIVWTGILDRYRGIHAIGDILSVSDQFDLRALKSICCECHTSQTVEAPDLAPIGQFLK